MNCRGVVETGNFRQVGGLCRVEVRLAQDGVGPTDAGRTVAVLGKHFLGSWHETRHAVVNENPVVHRPGTKTVPVRYEQPIACEGDALGRTEHFAARNRILAGEAVLADHQTRTVVGHPDRRTKGEGSNRSDDCRENGPAKQLLGIESHSGLPRRLSPARRRPSWRCQSRSSPSRSRGTPRPRRTLPADRRVAGPSGSPSARSSRRE